jgi:hypothetical protein
VRSRDGVGSPARVRLDGHLTERRLRLQLENEGPSPAVADADARRGNWRGPVRYQRCLFVPLPVIPLL